MEPVPGAAGALPTDAKAPPPVFPCTVKPVSFALLSIHVRSITVLDAAEATRLVGAAGASSPVVALESRQRSIVPHGRAVAHRKLLDPQSLVMRDGTDTVMRVWFRTEIPVQATGEQVRNGLTYRQIPEGTLVGAVEFPKAFTDYRKQRIPAGVYTLRFAIQPDTGDHTGTSPHREFCLICPAAVDTSAREIEQKELIELSSRVNEGRHPAVLLLWPNNGPDTGVKVLDKGNGVLAATIRRPVAAGERKTTLGFAVTVAGMRKE